MDTDRSVHPYYPPSARIPGYEADGRSVGAALPIFGGMVGAVAAGAYVLAARSPFRLGPWDRFAAAWFALCECFASCLGGKALAQNCPESL